MALILAIEPDPRQAVQITGIARRRLNAELILADTTERALDAVGDRVPDLVLVPALLSPQDDVALAAALRVIAAAANVRTLTIPVFASAAPRQASRTMLGRWRRARTSPAPDGCDPAVFAEQISTYLAEAVAERAALEPEPVINEPIIETMQVTAGFVVEPAAPAIEPVFELSLDDGTDTFIDNPAPIVPQPSIEAAATELFADDDFEQPQPASDVELWMPLSCGAARLWPPIEGVVSEFLDLSAEMFDAPPAPKSEHPEWTELIVSLRQDMERRRDAVEPTPITRGVPRRKTKPVQDEWGFFDPQQCGFAALLAKLDEITETSDEPASRLA